MIRVIGKYHCTNLGCDSSTMGDIRNLLCLMHVNGRYFCRIEHRECGSTFTVLKLLRRWIDNHAIISHNTLEWRVKQEPTTQQHPSMPKRRIPASASAREAQIVARQSGSWSEAYSLHLPPSTSMAIMYTSTTDLGKESTSTLETIIRSRRDEMDRISLSWCD